VGVEFEGDGYMLKGVEGTTGGTTGGHFGLHTGAGAGAGTGAGTGTGAGFGLHGGRLLPLHVTQQF